MNIFKLNNKGMTLIEIIVCFVLVTFISTALFGTVSAFNSKRSTESVKAKLLNYRNTVTRVIENDLVQKGLTNVIIVKKKSGQDFSGEHKATLVFRDGTTKDLIIHDKRAGDLDLVDTEEDNCTGENDSFYIVYDGQKYVLPDVGSSENSCATPEIVKDLRFSVINLENDDNVFLFYISFYHPELGTDYSINVVAPINYLSNSGKVDVDEEFEEIVVP